MTLRLAALLTTLLLSGSADAVERGGASVYDEPQRLSCGGRLDVRAMTVAHYLGATSAMPCGSRLAILYRDRIVIVRVVDNGPHVKGRKIDMTPEVARRLRFPGLGVVEFWRVY